MTYAFWLSVLVALGGCYGWLQGRFPTGCRVITLAALGATLALLILMGGLVCVVSIPVVMLLILVTALSDI